MSSSIGDALFTKTQQRVLSLLYGTPDKSFYTNEIMRGAEMGRGTIRRELDRLVNAGLLSVRRLGNQNHYQANQDNPVYTELLGIVKKTFGVADVIRLALKPLDSQIELAFIYGSIAKNTDDKKIDIDFEKPWDILTFSEETLKNMCGDRVRSTRKKFSKNVKNSLWWLQLLLERTYFESIVA